MTSLKQNARRITFLFGSGISIPAGLPPTQDITKKILSGENVIQYTDGTYYFNDSSNDSTTNQNNQFVQVIVKFLNKLKKEIDKYYSNNPTHQTSYEDLYYMAKQIHDSKLREYDNPIVQSFIDKLKHEIQSIIKNSDLDGIVGLSKETTNYISDLVCRLLSENSQPIDYLGCIRNACIDDQFSNVDFFTLNHDRIIEKYFCSQNLNYIDGFTNPRGNIRYWNPKLLEKENYKIKLFKLHGSIDWYRLWPENGDQYDEFIGIPIDSEQMTDNQGRRIEEKDSRPLLLIGTFNKIFNYISEIFIDLQCAFNKSLHKSKNLIICGYSFGDKAINGRIAEWICSPQNKRIIIIHKYSKKLKKCARGAISNKWDDLIQKNRLKLIHKNIENVTWEEIREHLLF